MIRGLFFDAAGVLYTRPHSAWEEALRLLTENGIAIAKNADLEAARRHIANEASLGRISSTTYLSRAFDLYGVTGPARAAILSAVDRFADEIIPTRDARDALGELKRKRKVLGVITDTMSRARARCVGSSVAGTSATRSIATCSAGGAQASPSSSSCRRARLVAATTPSFSGTP